jgi:hypothetical protein
VAALDTSPFIYYNEAHPVYLPRLEPFFDALARLGFRALTSTVTLIETLTQPLYAKAIWSWRNGIAGCYLAAEG